MQELKVEVTQSVLAISQGKSNVNSEAIKLAAHESTMLPVAWFVKFLRRKVTDELLGVC